MGFGLTSGCFSFVIYIVALQKDKDSELSFRWRHCNITQEPLEQPIAACGLGRLYKKQAVIESLLDRSILPESAAHIKSIKVRFSCES